jgi:hypothetical protein
VELGRKGSDEVFVDDMEKLLKSHKRELSTENLVQLEK